MEDQAQSRLIVAGVAHHLSKVLSAAKGLPKLQVKTEELMPFASIAVATVEPVDPKLNHGAVILYKREGKWMILTGRETARRAVDSGEATLSITLMTGQALKRAKVDSFVHVSGTTISQPYEAPASFSPQAKRSYENLDNPPRIIDKRTPRAATIESNRFNDSVSKPPMANRPDRPQFDRPAQKSNNSSFSGAHVSTDGPSRGAPQRTPGMQATEPKPFHVKRDKPVSLAEIGGYRNQPKADSQGRARYNTSHVNPKIEPGQDRPMEEFGQVNKVVTEIRQQPRVNVDGERRSTNRGLYGRNANSRTVRRDTK